MESYLSASPSFDMIPAIRSLASAGTSAIRVQDDTIRSCRILIFADAQCVETIRNELDSAGYSQILATVDKSVLSTTVTNREADLILIESSKLALEEVQETLVSISPEHRLPLLAMAERSDKVSRQLAVEVGVNDFVNLPVDGFELTTRVCAILQNRLAAEKLARYSSLLESDILVDPTTNIANRRAFDFELSRKMIEWQRQRTPVALIMLDIDYFKRVNDQHGHPAGDKVLAQTARSIEASLRQMDLVCRFGGEEFAIILPIKRPHESTQTAERIRQKIETEVFRFDHKELKLTVSIGVAEAMKGDDQQLIVKRADTALYESKQRGRNCVTFHNGARCVPIRKASEVGSDDQKLMSQKSLWSWAVHDDVFNVSASTILIVDDSAPITKLVRHYLDRGGFQNLLCETDSRCVMDRINSINPDLVLLDIEMPAVDGLTILKRVRADERFQNMPVIILTSHTDAETKSNSLMLGANDVLHKPVIASELLARVTNMLLASAHARFLANYTIKLEHEVKLRTAELIASRREAIQCLARTAEFRNDDGGRHIIRIGRYAAIIAEGLGFTEPQVVEMEHAAQLHDVGNIELPESILKKQDELTDEEFEVVKSHCNHGGKIIRDEAQHDPDSDDRPNLLLIESCSSSLMRMAAMVAESHHEKWDGTGYPHGLSGTNIPIEGRIAAVCDVFDALSNPNAHRDAYPLDECFRMIHEQRGTHFDPEVVDVFFERQAEIQQVYYDFTG